MEGFSQNIYGTLAEDLGPLKGQENLHGTGYDKRKGKGKKERERKESEWNLRPWEGAVKEESFLPAGTSACWRGDQSGQRGRFRASDENTPCLQQLEWRETRTDGQCLCPHSPVSDACLLGTGGGWVGKLGFQRSDPERGLGVDSVETV